VLLVATAASLIAGSVGPSWAHPFGDPESADISLTDSDTVRVHWKAGMVDDYTYLAEAIGALPDARETLDGAITPEVGDPFLVEHAAAFPAYLLEHITVRAGGRPCRGRVLPIDSLAAHGVDLDFTCTTTVASASIGITMLADLSSLYTTIATGPGGTQQVYTGTERTHEWSFAGARTATAKRHTHAASTALLPYLGGALALIDLALVVFLVRRRRRIARAAHQPALVIPDRAPPARIS